MSERSQPDEAADARLDHYLELRGWRTAEVEASCALARPLPIGGDFSGFWRIGGARVAKLGLRGGFFHPATGRTWPTPPAPPAARRAEGLQRTALHDLFEEQAKQLWKKRELHRSVNAAIAAAAPEARRATAERLYRLDAGTLVRFLGDRLGLLDRHRVESAAAKAPLLRFATTRLAFALFVSSSRKLVSREEREGYTRRRFGPGVQAHFPAGVGSRLSPG